MMQDILKKVCLLGMFSLVLPLGSAHAVNLWEEGTHAQPSGTATPKRVHPDTVPEDSQQVEYHWQKGREYQRGRRYELARQHFLLALSACRSEQTRDRLQRELQIVDLQLRSLR